MTFNCIHYHESVQHCVIKCTLVVLSTTTRVILLAIKFRDLKRQKYLQKYRGFYNYYIGFYSDDFLFNHYVIEQSAIKCLSYTVKPAHVVPSIKQSPVLKGHLY